MAPGLNRSSLGERTYGAALRPHRWLSCTTPRKHCGNTGASNPSRCQKRCTVMTLLARSIAVRCFSQVDETRVAMLWPCRTWLTSAPTIRGLRLAPATVPSPAIYSPGITDAHAPS